jgi:hypothetical protein
MAHAAFQRHAALFFASLQQAVAARRAEREILQAGRDKVGQSCLRAWWHSATNGRLRKASYTARARGFQRRVRRVKSLCLLKAWRRRCERSLRNRASVLRFFSRALWRLCIEVVARWAQYTDAQKRVLRALHATQALLVRRARHLLRAALRAMEQHAVQQVFEKHSAMVIASESELVDALVKACAGNGSSNAVFDAALQAIQRTKGLLHLVSCDPIYVSVGAAGLGS